MDLSRLKIKALWCKAYHGGHNYHAQVFYKLEDGPLMNQDCEQVGEWVEGKAKMVCKRCGAAKLIRMEIFNFFDGSRMVFSPDGPVKVI